MKKGDIVLIEKRGQVFAVIIDKITKRKVFYHDRIGCAFECSLKSFHDKIKLSKTP
jgi:hypothetical protein